MRRTAVVHGISLQEKRSVLNIDEQRAWLEQGILPERYGKKKEKK